MEAILGSLAIAGAFLWLMLETNWLRVRLARPISTADTIILGLLPIIVGVAAIIGIMRGMGNTRVSLVFYIIIKRLVNNLITGTGKASAKELKELKELASGEREGS